MEIEGCKNTVTHGHTAEEERAIRAAAEYWGWAHVDEFVSTHCDPQAREEFERRWGQQPAEDFEGFSRQLAVLIESEEREADDAWARSELLRVDGCFENREREAAQRLRLDLDEFRAHRWGSAEQRYLVMRLTEANAAGRIGTNVLAMLESVGDEDWNVIVGGEI